MNGRRVNDRDCGISGGEGPDPVVHCDAGRRAVAGRGWVDMPIGATLSWRRIVRNVGSEFR